MGWRSIHIKWSIHNTYTNAAGCDGVHTLNLTINNSTTSTVTQTACDSYTWNGTTYTSSGSYTYSTTNANGCDSTATLNLTINSSTTSTTTHTACDSYTWNGTTYTSSGSYTYSTTNANGCDSTAVLNLTINSSDASYTNITACDSYTWNDSTYTQSGTYSYSGDTISNNYSISFDASNNNEYIDCGDIQISGNELSFMSWIKLDNIPSQIGNVFRQHWSDGHWLRFENLETKINFNVNTSTQIPGTSTYASQIESQTSLNINEWYHVAAVYDGASLKIYINGILDQQGSYSGSLTTYSGIGEHFYLGAGNNSNLIMTF